MLFVWEIQNSKLELCNYARRQAIARQRMAGSVGLRASAIISVHLRTVLEDCTTRLFRVDATSGN